MAEPLTAQERDELVRQAVELHAVRIRKAGGPRLSQDEQAEVSERFYLAVGEYFDRLPRVTMSACAYCGEPLVRAFDPWGLDGLWWAKSPICKFEEPRACEHFRALLGAVRLDAGALPSRMIMDSFPGPEVPFVVPHLLDLPNMIAVVGKLPLARGGTSYPIGYFSDVVIDPVELHQNWCRTVLWFEQGNGQGWTIANDLWDFELDPYLQSEKLRWVLLDAGESRPRVRRAADGEACPFVGVAGERRPQQISPGARTYGELPDGTPPDPYAD